MFTRKKTTKIYIDKYNADALFQQITTSITDKTMLLLTKKTNNNLLSFIIYYLLYHSTKLIA